MMAHSFRAFVNGRTVYDLDRAIADDLHCACGRGYITLSADVVPSMTMWLVRVHCEECNHEVAWHQYDLDKHDETLRWLDHWRFTNARKHIATVETSPEQNVEKASTLFLLKKLLKIRDFDA